MGKGKMTPKGGYDKEPYQEDKYLGDESFAFWATLVCGIVIAGSVALIILKLWKF